MSKSTFAIATSLLAAGLSFAAPLSPDTPLVEDPAIGVKVTALDFEGVLLRIPETARPEARSTYDRVATLVDQVYIPRLMATKARQAGIDKDPAVQRRLQQVQESLLTELYLQHFDKQVKMPDLEQRARELYKGNPSGFMKSEEVYVQHILVTLNGRTREMALERAKQVHAEVVAAPADQFTALAKRLSEDPDAKKNSGDLGWSSPVGFEVPFAQKLATMKVKGEVSEPVETRFGFHIIKFVDRKAAYIAPFADVQQRIMAREKESILKEQRDLLLKNLRDSDTVVVYRANVESLVQPIDKSRKALEAAKAAPADAKK